MKEILLIVVAVIAILFILHLRNNQKRKKMEDELNNSVQDEVSESVKKESRIWTIIKKIIFCLLPIILIILFHKEVWEDRTLRIIVCMVCVGGILDAISRYYLKKRWGIPSVEESQAADDMTEEVIKMLGCNITRLKSDVESQTLLDTWQEAYERGKQEGFYPILLLVDGTYMEHLDANVMTDEQHFRQWQQQVLSSPVADIDALLRKYFDLHKNEWEELGEDIIGEVETYDGLYDEELYIYAGNLLLVEIPVSEPWQVFAHIPFGGRSDCPSAEEHLAFAKHFYEKYGAMPICITPNNITYRVQQPVSNDTMTLAKEQFAYSKNFILDLENLSTAAEVNKRITIWNFYWDD